MTTKLNSIILFNIMGPSDIVKGVIEEAKKKFEIRVVDIFEKDKDINIEVNEDLADDFCELCDLFDSIECRMV